MQNKMLIRAKVTRRASVIFLLESYVRGMYLIQNPEYSSNPNDIRMSKVREVKKKKKKRGGERKVYTHAVCELVSFHP